jgi:bifunctional enzyme CysN/CysC
VGIREFLKEDAAKDLLRLVIVGSVDDGKSTLVGRLLHDCQAVYEDQLASVRSTTAKKQNVDAEIDYSLFTDGLKAEREQGITIDVAYRYFATHKRKFILADTPGHEQYTRNMATGASNAEAAVILIDARLGVLPQSRRHGFIAHLLGLRHLTVAVNKMDLVDYSPQVFDRIRAEYTAFIRQLGRIEPHFIPVSALRGENIVHRAPSMPWYHGPTLLELLESLPAGPEAGSGDLRFPIQYVQRPNRDFRGFSGTIASGTLRQGDEIVALPGLRRTRVRQIVTADGELREATTGQPVTVVMEDEIDLGRGDMLAAPIRPPAARQRLAARLVWFDDRPALPGASYWVRHTTRTVVGLLAEIRARVEIGTLGERPATRLQMNDIGTVVLELQQPLFADPYDTNRATGSFVLIDRRSNMTAAAGMFLPLEEDESAAGNTPACQRELLLGHRGAVLGVSASSHAVSLAFARQLELHLIRRGVLAYTLDVPPGPSMDDGSGSPQPAPSDLALVLADAGVIAITPDAPLQTAEDAPSDVAISSETSVRVTVHARGPGATHDPSAGGVYETSAQTLPLREAAGDEALAQVTRFLGACNVLRSVEPPSYTI